MHLNSNYTRDNLHAESAHESKRGHTKEGDICPSLYLQISRHVRIYAYLQHCIAIAVGCRPVYTSLYLRLHLCPPAYLMGEATLASTSASTPIGGTRTQWEMCLPGFEKDNLIRSSNVSERFRCWQWFCAHSHSCTPVPQASTLPRPATMRSPTAWPAARARTRRRRARQK